MLLRLKLNNSIRKTSETICSGVDLKTIPLVMENTSRLKRRKNQQLTKYGELAEEVTRVVLKHMRPSE